eukprot:1158902-Pelagomonas_calceolata.AAC.3
MTRGQAFYSQTALSFEPVCLHHVVFKDGFLDVECSGDLLVPVDSGQILDSLWPICSLQSLQGKATGVCRRLSLMYAFFLQNTFICVCHVCSRLLHPS